ncbi:MAG: thiol:disulfide interchange protein DsbA/DsbL [Gammaproteobacteria bacterium]|nr:thiol:disulfide interchange protein DsbA/DsbL [Gammaproteobacteria bacterium]
MTTQPYAPSLLASILLVLSIATGPGVAAEPVEGVNYERIDPPQTTQAADGKVEVVEVFWYGCPHCYDFEPFVSAWRARLPADVDFRRVPGVFRSDWVPGAKAYYVASELGIVDAIHKPLFDAIHRDKRRLFDEESLAEFFAEQGVAKAEFEKAWNSFAVDSKVRQALALARGYGIGGVPSMIVAGKYRTSASMVDSPASLDDAYEGLLKIVDYLVDKERGESVKSPQPVE